MFEEANVNLINKLKIKKANKTPSAVVGPAEALCRWCSARPDNGCWGEPQGSGLLPVARCLFSDLLWAAT